MVLKTNDRRTSCPCHDEFRGPRSDCVRQIQYGKLPVHHRPSTFYLNARHHPPRLKHLNPSNGIFALRLSQSVISSMHTSSFNGVVPRSHCVGSRHVNRQTTDNLPKHSVRS
ncbi:hypothetical protein TNCV_954491 [Trichonephila clavipes]|nr:hypothetical protein TNCV_954491 [Trichonephila clavipes]